MYNMSMVKSFLLLVNTSSFTEAARQSYFTQQAISKQIAKLEKELDCPLFVRLHNGVKLTEEGEIYYRAFSQAVALIDQAGEQVEQRRMSRNEHLRFGYLEMLVLDNRWKEFLHHYRINHPGLEVEIRTYPEGGGMEALMEDEIDAAILFCDETEVRRKGLRCITLPSNKTGIYLCLNKNYPGVAEAADYRDLRNVPLLFNTADSERALRRAQAADLEPERISFRDSISAALVAVNMLEGGILVGDHTEFRDNQDLVFFETPDRGMGTKILWKEKNCKSSLWQMMNAYQDYANVKKLP